MQGEGQREEGDSKEEVPGSNPRGRGGERYPVRARTECAGSHKDGVQVPPFRNKGIGRCQSGIRPPVLAWSLWPSATVSLQMPSRWESMGDSFLNARGGTASYTYRLASTRRALEKTTLNSHY
eukprot:1159290-Pelagomonas_calceolata.AAC.5